MEGSGVSFAGLLTVAFIVLKLTGVIAWSWWVVLLPVLLPVFLLVVINVLEFITSSFL